MSVLLIRLNFFLIRFISGLLSNRFKEISSVGKSESNADCHLQQSESKLITSGNNEGMQVQTIGLVYRIT